MENRRMEIEVRVSHVAADKPIFTQTRPFDSDYQCLEMLDGLVGDLKEWLIATGFRSMREAAEATYSGH